MFTIVFGSPLSNGQEIAIREIKGDTIVHISRLRDSVDSPRPTLEDSIFFSKIRDLFSNCMKEIPKKADYQLYINFSFNIGVNGYTHPIASFEYSKRLSPKLATFKTEKLLEAIPKIWIPAKMRESKIPIMYQVDVSCLFNHNQMTISFSDINGYTLFPEVKISN
jgi:hypothetical protein